MGCKEISKSIKESQSQLFDGGTDVFRAPMLRGAAPTERALILERSGGRRKKRTMRRCENAAGWHLTPVDAEV